MTGNTVIFVTDQRQQHMAEYLPGKIRPLDWRRGAAKSEALAVLEDSDRIILPTPASKIEKNYDVYTLLKEELTKEYVKKWCVFAGVISPVWKQRFEDAGVTYYDLMEDAAVVHRNARITAEATVAEILKYSAYSIYGQKIIVCGYGRCGKSVADLLAAMGAKVTILARSAKARQMARGNGHEAVDFSYGPEEVYGARTIVNTVPAQVIREPMIQEMHKDTVIIDIASRPGGVDLVAAERQEIKVVAALGLPGIYTTKSSAKVFADAVISQMQLQQCKGGGKTWIYQIVI